LGLRKIKNLKIKIKNLVVWDEKKSIQVWDFGVITSEDVVNGGHSGICCDDTVIGSSNCNTRSTYN
jgi:hypothetical protein